MEFYIKNENITSGFIEDCSCHKCGFRNTIFTITGDSWAMNFLGVIGLTSEHRMEIVVTYLTKDEFQNYRTIKGKDISDRVNQLLNRNDLLFFKKQEAEKGSLVVPCPKCQTPLELTNRRSLEQYVEQGGKIMCLNYYEK